ncbi:MAG TPA: RdgB/HAM1 family non-canonical purine NTP pyrophosphatase [Steroidobacteraceae bacterium]|nr:RdgB/HAM1 family non-canonical purine NTP pyrophosphatase [Steroidobacteraceae bacterium]
MPHRSAHAAAERLVVATGNAGKLREFAALLAGLPFAIVAQNELGIVTPAETGSTFAANALLKARHAARLSGAAAIADDSGLEVDALGGAPGVHSARYAGAAAGDARNNAKLLAALDGVPIERRRARFRCALVFLPALPQAPPIIVEGVWEGMIATAARGASGFGYDPLFFLPELGLTAAELEPQVKNRLSHRYLAMRALYERLSRRR